MNWNLILWKGPKPPSQTTNRFWKSQDKHHGQSCFQWWSTFLVSHCFYFSLFFGPAINENSLKFEKKVFPILENDKILFFEEYVPNLLFPKQNESQSPQVDCRFLTGGAAVVASGTLRGCGGGTLRRRPLWLSTLLSTSPWSARTKLDVATAVLVLSVESLIWEGIHWTFGGSNPHERAKSDALFHFP